ncbi:hypothetical protein ACIQUQ_07580 [Streptomyces sp. NPDC101118]|uniref:hypothetical protein n=1 Tax=Streptomyces sp. NPDC101118 TaxID=3366109 RepID=UPI0038052240
MATTVPAPVSSAVGAAPEAAAVLAGAFFTAAPPAASLVAPFFAAPFFAAAFFPRVFAAVPSAATPFAPLVFVAAPCAAEPSAAAVRVVPAFVPVALAALVLAAVAFFAEVVPTAAPADERSPAGSSTGAGAPAGRVFLAAFAPVTARSVTSGRSAALSVGARAADFAACALPETASEGMASPLAVFLGAAFDAPFGTMLAEVLFTAVPDEPALPCAASTALAMLFFGAAFGTGAPAGSVFLAALAPVTARSVTSGRSAALSVGARAADLAACALPETASEGAAFVAVDFFPADAVFFAAVFFATMAAAPSHIVICTRIVLGR